MKPKRVEASSEALSHAAVVTRHHASHVAAIATSVAERAIGSANTSAGANVRSSAHTGAVGGVGSRVDGGGDGQLVLPEVFPVQPVATDAAL